MGQAYYSCNYLLSGAKMTEKEVKLTKDQLEAVKGKENITPYHPCTDEQASIYAVLLTLPIRINGVYYGFPGKK